MKIKSITTIPEIHYERVIDTLSYLIARCTHDIRYSSKNNFQMQVIDLTDNIRVFVGQNPISGKLYVGIAENDGYTPGIPILIGNDLMDNSKIIILQKLFNEFDLFYDEECDTITDELEYNAIATELVDEISALSVIIKLEI